MNKVIKDKKYVSLKQKTLIPTETGTQLCDFLVQHFAQVFDVGYTARLEAQLDEIASGSTTRLNTLKAFWQDFQPALGNAAETVLDHIKQRPQPEPTGERCPECGGGLLKRQGKQGTFIGCSNYPTCTYTQAAGSKPLVLRPAAED